MRHSQMARITSFLYFFGLLGFLQAADKSGVSPNTISLPTGPGSIEGLGESFQPTLNTGTAKYAVKLALPPGPAGSAPSLGLSYEGGSGNGPLGFGWNLPTAYVQRECDKGIPRYVDGNNGLDDDFDGETDEADEIDVFINEMKEELVPQVDGNYFCENEGAFIRYRRNGDHWEGTLPNGTRLDFGITSEGRVQDASTGRTFKWLLQRTTDTRGNTTMYSYRAFPGETNTNQKYLAGLTYGPGSPPWDNFHFVTFIYENRSDWFEDCRAGFIVRSGKRLTEIVVGTQGPTLARHLVGDFNSDSTPDHLVRKYRLSYLNYAGTNSHWSLLSEIRPVGADGTSTLPPSTFGYAICNPPDMISALGKEIGGLNEPNSVMDSELVDLVDLNGDGLPDILNTDFDGGAHAGFINLGEVVTNGIRSIQWSEPREVATEDGQAWGVNLRSGDDVAHLADMDGDGLADLVYKSTIGDVYYFANRGRRAWGPRQQMSAQDESPPSPFGGTGTAKTADIDFDKRMDVIQSIDVGGGADYRIWFNRGQQSYSRSVTVPQSSGFTLSQKAVHVADFNGDRLPDVIWVGPVALIVTAGLGHGHFADPVTVPLVDFTLDPIQLETAKLQDVTGDGLVDLVIERAEPGQLSYWVNQGTYTLSQRKTVSGMPTALGPQPAIRWADLNGNGTTDLIYADSVSEPRLRTVDIGELIGCVPRPNTLKSIANGIGRVTTIGYQPSTRFALEDAAANRPWPDVMPFPVMVVACVTNSDSLGHSYVIKFRYHDGYYDAEEKEFRGFARVELVEVGDVTAPTLVTRSHFDTGREYEAMKGKLLRLSAEQEDGKTFWDEVTSWTRPPVALMTGTNGQTVNYAHPTGKLRTVKELGQGTERLLESEFAYDGYGNVISNADYGIVENGDRSAFDDERITVTEYALNLTAWIVRFPKRQEIRDEGGAVVSRADSFYDDETFSGSNIGQVTIGNLTLRREWISPSNSSATISSARTQYDSYGNPTVLIDPLGIVAGGAANFSKGHARVLDYDNRFHTYPVTETIHIGNGSASLVFQAAYDEGFATVTISTDFNENQTIYGYDAFARLVTVVRPGDTPAYPTAEYDYAFAVRVPRPVGEEGIVNYVETRQRDKFEIQNLKSDMYLISRQYVDGLGRALLTKREAGADIPGGPSRVVVNRAALFNARQRPVSILNPFYTTMSGNLDALLAYESIEIPGWAGIFQENGSLGTLNLSNAHQTATRYDATLREIEAINADGTKRQTVFEPLLTKSYDENDTDLSSSHSNTPMLHYADGLGRLIRVDEVTRLNDDGTPSAVIRLWTSHYQYDVNDQLARLTDSQNNLKWMTYDGLKRKTFMNDPDKGEMTYIYDEGSNLKATTDAKNQHITYTYDGANRILAEKYHDGCAAPPWRLLTLNPETSINSVIYHYDTPSPNVDQGDNTTAVARNTKGTLTWVEDLSGEEHTSYDSRGRVEWTVKRIPDPVFLSSHNPQLATPLVSYRTAFTYDSLDRIATLTYPDADQITYEYNNRNQLQRIPGGPNGSVISNLVYWPSDQLAQIDYGNGICTTYGYDSRLRLTNLRTARRSALAGESDAMGELIHTHHQFDGASNIEHIDDRRPEFAVPAGDKRRNTQMFQYDDLYRLVRVQYSFQLPNEPVRSDGEISYRYDRIGNMLAQTSTIDHQENGIPIANVGEMESGGSLGRSNRRGRARNDPPGPHALTSTRHSALVICQYPYDSNGNMLIIDGLTNTWDFKDRLIVAENSEMRAEYTYDYTDRRIIKNVGYKSGDTNFQKLDSRITTIYANKFFEVRDHDAPTKFIWNGNTRVARVTGSLNSEVRVQSLRIYPGWNIISLAVSAPDTLAQLNSLCVLGGDEENELVQCIFKWSQEELSWLQVAPTEILPAGTVLWLRATTNAILRLVGTYSDPASNTSVSPQGAFLPSAGLEAWNFKSAISNLPAASAWNYLAKFAGWRTLLPIPLDSQADLPTFLAPGEVVFVRGKSSTQLEHPASVMRVRYYHQDHLESSAYVSDAAGQLIEETEFYPFGHPRHEYHPREVREDYKFTQKERDSESGLHYFEARFLTCRLGSFASSDPLSMKINLLFGQRLRRYLENPQRLNAYAYARNNPIIFNDPSGLEEENPEKKGRIGHFLDVAIVTLGITVGVVVGNPSTSADDGHGRPIGQRHNKGQVEGNQNALDDRKRREEEKKNAEDAKTDSARQTEPLGTRILDAAERGILVHGERVADTLLIGSGILFVAAGAVVVAPVAIGAAEGVLIAGSVTAVVSTLAPSSAILPPKLMEQ